VPKPSRKRAGYAPTDYPTDAEWAARLLIERSSAAKCPTAAYQLAGSKKVQQALAAPGAVEHFVGEEGGAALRGLFAGARPRPRARAAAGCRLFSSWCRCPRRGGLGGSP
jgi:hypothetical protein